MAAPGENLRINGARLWESIHEMAKIGPGVGNNRQTLTDDDAKGHLFRTWCEEADLSSTEEGRRKAKRHRAAARAVTPQASPGPLKQEPSERERRVLASLDLHGMTVEEALGAVGLHLDAAIRAGLDRVEIIHGISGGRLRGAVRAFLARCDPLRTSQSQENVTWR